MLILQDTREQAPWDFTFYDDIEVEVRKLRTGDYTIAGLEDILTVERKRETSEIAQNIGKDKTRFDRELERMAQLRYAFLICEFSIDNVMEFPANSGIPKSKWKDVRINGKFILKTLYSYRDKYGISLHFCDNKDNACKVAVEEMRRIEKMVA